MFGTQAPGSQTPPPPHTMCLAGGVGGLQGLPRSPPPPPNQPPLPRSFAMAPALVRWACAGQRFPLFSHFLSFVDTPSEGRGDVASAPTRGPPRRRG